MFETHTNLVTPDEMKGKFPNGLAEAMARRPGVSQAALAKIVGTSQQQIGKLVHGEREMTALWAEKLAPTLRTSPEQLVFPSLRRFRAPLLSWVSAGVWPIRKGCGNRTSGSMSISRIYRRATGSFSRSKAIPWIG